MLYSSKAAMQRLLVICLMLASAQAFAANAHSLYQRGLAFEQAGQYGQALGAYQRFLAKAKKTDANYDRVKFKLPVLNEAKRHPAGEDVELYLHALDARADGNSDDALLALRSLINSYPNSYLLDDALYLSGYIYSMDRFQFKRAQQSMAELRRRVPNSTYVDASLYMDAIVLEQQGQTAAAKRKFETLRNKHAVLNIELLGFSLPRNTYQARLWFDRASQRIKAIDKQELVATKIVNQSLLFSGGYQRRVTLAIANEQVTVLLNPALITASTRFLDQYGQALDASAVKVFDGVVEGVDDSWVRAVFHQGKVQGLISRRGKRYDLKTDAVTGTMVNYNPSLQSDARDGHKDTVLPPAEVARFSSKNNGVNYGYGQRSVTRVAPISTVLDSQFNAYNSGRGLFEALTVLAIADGIYREELGIALRLDTLVSIKERNGDPMNIGHATMDSMLSNFRDYRRSSSTLHGSNAAYVYLFSGNTSSDNQVGLAYIDVACRTDGYDVSVSTPYQRNYLLAAHEMAHNLGAKHDVDTHCSGDSTKIMAPYFTQDTQHRFSRCSKAAISRRVKSRCFEDAIDLQAQLTAVSSSTIGAAIRNNDLMRATTAALEVRAENTVLSELPDNCQLQPDGTAKCDFGVLAAGEVKLLEIGTEQGEEGLRRIAVRAKNKADITDVVVANNSQAVSLAPGEELEWPLAPSTSALGHIPASAGSTGPAGVLVLLALWGLRAGTPRV